VRNEEGYRENLEIWHSGQLRGPAARDKARLNLLKWAARALPGELKRLGGKPGFERFAQMLGLVFPYGLTRAVKLLPRRRVVPANVRGVLIRAARQVLSTFRPRGEVVEVLVSHAVLAYLGAGVADHRRQFRRVLDWLGRVDVAAGPDPAVSRSVVRALMKVAALWPSPMVLQEMRTYVEIMGDRLAQLAPKLPPATAPRQSKKVRAIRLLVRRCAFYLVQPYLLADRFKEALQVVQRLSKGMGTDPLLEKLLRKVLSPGSVPADYLVLANYFMDEALHVAQAVCRAALKRFPKSAQAWSYLGRVAERREHLLRAIVAYESAVRLKPTWYPPWEKLATGYLRRLHVYVVRQRLNHALRLLEVNRKFHVTARLRWPTRPLKVGLERAYFAAGRAHANVGKVDKAIGLYRKSIAVRSMPQVHVELGSVFLWRHKYRKAVEQFRKAVRAAKGPAEKLYWAGKVAVRLSTSLKRQGRGGEARRILVGAASGILRLASLIRSREMKAELVVDQAHIMDALGRRDQAVRLLQIAVDLAPERTSTYADAMAFVVSRGLMDDALDLHSRAVVRDSVSEYMKTYVTFWILDLGRRCGVERVRLEPGWAHLRKLKGSKWYHRLAQLELGRVTYRRLMKEANTIGRRAELDFYEGMRQYRAGNLAGARKLWKAVLRSGMYVFFEYKMAERYLRRKPVCPAPGSRLSRARRSRRRFRAPGSIVPNGKVY
jgi:tetratricopeptide (TPR) repeat protein